MNTHTRFVGALNAVILSLSAAVTVVMVATLLNPSFDPSNLLVRRGTVTIQQLPMDDNANVRHM